MAKSFEQVLEQEKNELTEALILFGEGKRVNKALADLEMNRPEFYKFYEAGKQSKQAEIDNLSHQDYKMNTYFIKGDEVGYISSEDTQDYGFFIPVFCSSSEDELIEKCAELNKLRLIT